MDDAGIPGGQDAACRRTWPEIGELPTAIKQHPYQIACCALGAVVLHTATEVGSNLGADRRLLTGGEMPPLGSVGEQPVVAAERPAGVVGQIAEKNSRSTPESRSLPSYGQHFRPS